MKLNKFFIALLFSSSLYASNLNFVNYNNNKSKSNIQIISFNFTPLHKIEKTGIDDEDEEEKKFLKKIHKKFKKIEKKLEINFFGYTYHLSNYFDKNTMDTKAPDHATNVGIGFNYYFYKNFFITANFLKNCVNFNDYILGLGYSFNNLINYKFFKHKFDLLLGLMYYKTKYLKVEKELVPFYFLRYNITDRISLNASYIPESFSPTKKDKFVFFALSFRYK